MNKSSIFAMIAWLGAVFMGSSCRMSPTVGGYCERNQGLISFSTREAGFNYAVMDERGELVLTGSLRGDGMRESSLPVGEYRYTLTREGADAPFQSGVLSVQCTERVAVSENAGPVVEYYPLDPVTPTTAGLRLSEEVLQNLLLRVPLDIDSLLTAREQDCRIINPPTAETIARLVPSSTYRLDSMVATFTRNKTYIENFFRTHWPVEYAELGEVVRVTPVALPSTGTDAAEVRHAVQFEVNEGYLQWNDRESSAGAFFVYDWNGEDYSSVMVVRPEFSSSYGLEIRATYQAGEMLHNPANLDNLYWRYSPEPTAGNMFEMAMVPSRCSREMLYPSARARYAGFPWGPMTPRNPVSVDCLRKELSRTVRGHSDFIRRKMMDLSGEETWRLDWDGEPGASSFTFYYESPYSCLLEVLFDD